MAKRIITSIIGLVIFFAVLFAGKTAFTVAIFLVTLGMLVELYTGLKSNNTLNLTGFICAVMLLLGMIFESISKELMTFLCIGTYLAVMVNQHKRVAFKDVCTHGFLTFFITTFFGTMIRIRAEFGTYAVLLAFVCAWITDSGAYFTGRAIGKTKLMPKVSPKKTVEGAVGGIVAAVVFSWIYMSVINKVPTLHPQGTINYFSITIIALITSVFSQLGDLVASSIKRDCNIKDFGNILPGHGGILDRFDSVIYITPLIYYMLILFA